MSTSAPDGRDKKTWLIIGASRGIGHEFVRQALAKGDRVVATVRRPDEQTALFLWPELMNDGADCKLFGCDMLSPQSIYALATEIALLDIMRLDYVVLNAGVLKYPNRATEISYEDFTFHLQTNTVGPMICAQALLSTQIPIGSITFISSDSGSAQKFRAFEDGFGIYGASKAALNHSLRHMAAELERKGSRTTVLALHPGEVATDMANVEVSWEVEGQMTTQESVEGCIRTIESKTLADNGTFWTWRNEQYPW